ncbi:MAG: translation initiation factor IF-3, partial [Myxococcales bacterium]
EEGDKARVTIMFRGREVTHKEIGQRILQDVISDLKDVAVVETAPRMEGRQMYMILALNPKWKPPKPAKAEGAAKPEGARADAPKAEAPKPQPPAAQAEAKT